ncbi:MAG: hypothetical protein A2428_10285 [Bdellovibrionales bacterium RIFOXYC1_FULL_54_43]|nr:MAG: hypothetical protein A2428_10285 [Bdellovibrionales bacterium RIFOXYC1_FULL_54_43]OFZ80375.1 MAG: hypothetical protein A2603_13410 [Bdellovibrionales bacterium RIFOXYD1_FULL_55_31]
MKNEPAIGLEIGAEFDLGRRALSASLGQITLLFIFIYATRFQDIEPWHSELILGGLIFLFNMARFHLAYSQARYYPEHRRCWKRLFSITVIVPAASWGSLLALAIHRHGFADYQVAILILIASGISAAVTTSVAPWQSLGRIFAGLVLGIPFVKLLLMMNRESLSCALIFLSYYGFLWFQLKIQSGVYWNGLHYQRHLRDEKQRLQAVLDSIPGPVLWINRDLVCRGVNKNYAANFGAQPDDLAGEKLDVRNGDRDLLGVIREFMASDVETTSREIPIMLCGMRRRHFLVMRKVNSDCYIVGIDIQDLKEAQWELEQQRIKSEMTGKLAAIGEFTAGIAHEIKNPITVVKTALDLMNKNLGCNEARLADEKTRTLLDRAAASCARIDKIVQGLTKFSRKTADEPLTQVRLAEVIDDSLNLIQPALRSNGVQMKLEPIDNSIVIRCRPIEISQVLVNLLGNAVEAAKNQNEKWVKLGVRSSGEQIQVEITDSGPGVPEELREKIFEPFFTTKPPGAGTGLGLSISRRIIERYGGRIDIDHAEGHTTFVIRLPVWAKQADAA